MDIATAIQVAIVVTVVLAITVGIIAFDEWRWRKAIDAMRADNNAVADRAVAECEPSHHGRGQ